MICFKIKLVTKSVNGVNLAPSREQANTSCEDVGARSARGHFGCTSQSGANVASVIKLVS